MEKRYKIAKKSFFNRKIIAIVLLVLIFFLVGQVNIRYKLIDPEDTLMNVLICFILGGIPFIYILIAIRNYKVIGHLTFNPNEIKLKTKSAEATFDIKDIEYINLIYKGIYGDDYSGILVGFGSTYSKDGSGNILEFKHEENTHAFNIVFDDIGDYNAIVRLFEMIEKRNNIKPEIIKT